MRTVLHEIVIEDDAQHQGAEVTDNIWQPGQLLQHGRSRFAEKYTIGLNANKKDGIISRLFILQLILFIVPVW